MPELLLPDALLTRTVIGDYVTARSDFDALRLSAPAPRHRCARPNLPAAEIAHGTEIVLRMRLSSSGRILAP